MDFITFTLVAWTAFAAAAILPGFLGSRVARRLGHTHA